MDREEIFRGIRAEVEEIIQGSEERDEKLLGICRLLKERIPHYDWVGFYLADPDKKDELVLGPYVGEPTEHVRIPFGKGICGRAAVEEDTVVIQDVNKQDNYLSCSPFVRSEVVVPIIVDERFVGELDIDSNDLGPFTEEDRSFLEDICRRLSTHFKLTVNGLIQ